MRERKIIGLLEEKGLDGFLFSSQANVLYLSGFRSSNAYVLATKEGFTFYRRTILREGKGNFEGGMAGSFGKIFHAQDYKANYKKLGIKRVGYEEDRVSCAFRKSLRSRDIQWVGFSNFLGKLRAIKSTEEIKIMKEGVLKADQIYRELLEFVKPGMTELDLRGFIVRRAFEMGAMGESFPAIVAFAEGSAVPHWETSQRRIEQKGPLLIDMGILYKNYCTDFTRTIYLGKADDEFKRSIKWSKMPTSLPWRR